MGKNWKETSQTISSNTFDVTLLDSEYSSTLDFTHHLILNMRPEFVKSVNQNILGFYLFYEDGVLKPIQ